MLISKEQFIKVFGAVKDADEIVEALNPAMILHAIDTKDRIAAFLSQVGHESGHFKARVENLNYSQQSLRKVFPKYFPTDELAAAYARKPEKIANRVYGGRMGNGPEASGDGWRYRGRGYLQLTGKNNYAACSKSLYGDDRLLKHPELIETVSGSILSACWFWQSNNLNALADKKDIVAVSKRVNGGTIGLEDRRKLYNLLQSVL